MKSACAAVHGYRFAAVPGNTADSARSRNSLRNLRDIVRKGVFHLQRLLTQFAQRGDQLFWRLCG